MLKNYNNCVFCGSKQLVKQKNQKFLDNFYLRAVRNDLKISINFFKKLKVYQCKKCYIIQNNPWFSENFARKIYSSIYGQHNRNWTNLINFYKKGTFPNHGNLFEIVSKTLKVKNYVEFNSPFMGLLLNYLSCEYSSKNNFFRELVKNLIKYLSLRQVAGYSNKKIEAQNNQIKKIIKLVNKLKIKNFLKKHTNKYLLIDNSPLSWGQNDNYKSVNSKSLASELFDLNIIDINRSYKKQKFDLFGIFHTLDHTFEPKKILDFAIKYSDYVIVYCHVDRRLEKQHLFSFTNQFLKYLKNNNIYFLDLTDSINKNYKVPELYFICSKKKKLIKSFELKLFNFLTNDRKS